MMLAISSADAQPLAGGSALAGRAAEFDPATNRARKVSRSKVTSAANPYSSTWCFNQQPGVKLKDVGADMVLFIGFARLTSNYRAARYLLRSASPRQQKKYARLAAFYQLRMGYRSPYVKACRKAGAGGASAVSPLRFDFSGAIGVTVGSAMSRRGRVAVRQADGGIRAILPSGALRDAIVSGTARISSVAVSPSGQLVITFQQKVYLDDATSAGSSEGCAIATVDRATGIPTCIDPSLSLSIPGVQFDDAGGIYYRGSSGASFVLRRYRNGVITDLVNAQISVNHFLVAPNGIVVLNGSTNATGVAFVRRYSPSGGILALGPPASTFGHLRLFADGNVYMAEAGRGIARFLTTTDAMDPTLWIGRPATNDSSVYCAGAGVGTGPCGSGSVAGFGAENTHAQTSTGKDFIPGTNGIVQAFPTLATYTTPLLMTSIMAASGTTLLLAGTAASGENLLVSFDTTTNTPTTIASRASANGEIEFYHVEPASDGTALFDGLRFSDNTYVIGRINCATGDVTILSTVTGKLSDFMAF